MQHGSCDAAMSGLGQSRHFGRRPTTSGLPLKTDIVRAGRHVAKVPRPEVTRRTWKSPLPCIQRDAFWLRTLEVRSKRGKA